MSERVPAFMRHMQLVSQHAFNQGRGRTGGELIMDSTVMGEDREWFLDTVIKGTSRAGKTLDVVIRQRFKRVTKHSARWTMDNPRVTQDGEESVEKNKDVSKIIEELLKQGSPMVGDLTGAHGTDTHGPRSNSVETRRASVIRV